MDERRDFYVYVHRDRKGNIFYVGKGTGKRAWSTNRHAVWHRYVDERLGGYYEVEIVLNRLTEQEAEEYEEELIAKYGPRLVNWVNPGRNFDYIALEQFHRLRDANRRFIEETKAIECIDLEGAVERYRLAMNRMREYEALVLEHGLISELMDWPKAGEPTILDRLTLCLVKLGRAAEAASEAEQYFSDFPAARERVIGKQIMKRLERKSKQKAQ